MAARSWFRWLAACVALAGWAVPALAQSPSICSSADQQRYSKYRGFIEQALLRGENGKAIDLSRDMDVGLSRACRAALDRDQPVRVRCSLNERKVTLQQLTAMMAAGFQNDRKKFFASFKDLEASVSSDCWLSINQTGDPRLRQACSASDLDVMASYAGPFGRVAERAIARARPGEVPDTTELEPLLEEEYSKVSRKCQLAWDRIAEEALTAAKAEVDRPPPSRPVPSFGNGLQMPPRVYDLGRGNFSAPGIGACGPGGCIVFRLHIAPVNITALAATSASASTPRAMRSLYCNGTGICPRPDSCLH
jgi:hypothetical protein